MNRMKFFVVMVIACLVFTPGGSILAGSSQSGGEMHFPAEEIIKFAKKVEKTLAQKGARVAIIARLGVPQKNLPEGIHFTHTGFAVYSDITTADGRHVPGYAVYNLYQRAKTPNISDLVQDYPVDFFAAVPVLKAGLIIPSPELQNRLLTTISSPVYKKLHNPKYSNIANPFTLAFQNCTEHTLDVIMAAIYETEDLNQIKANEKAYFKAQPLKVNRAKLLLGSMFISDITTSDHPGKPETATFTTIGNFMKKYDAGSQVLIVTPES